MTDRPSTRPTRHEAHHEARHEVMARKLTIDDIADIRAYEREREGFRAHVIDLKRRRRVPVGTIITFVFEHRDTVRFQIQEMARVERLTTDDQIQTELDIYNPMIPEPGQMCATMFIELVSDDQIREWLPRLANVERSVVFVLADGSRIRGTIDEGHEQGLTRQGLTAAVHYLRWGLAPDQIDVFATGDVRLEIDHPSYLESVVLGEAAHAELLADLRPDLNI